MFESLFKNSLFLVIIIVIMSFIASVVLYATSINIIYYTLIDIYEYFPVSPYEGQLFAVKLLKILDILLIALVFQIIGVSHYYFFISRQNRAKSRFMHVLHINNYHDLKIIILQVATIILTILFLEQAVEIGAKLETLYLAGAYGIMIMAIVFLTKSMKV